MNTPNFTNKVISLSLYDDDSNHDLMNPYFETLGDRLFITGHIPAGATDSGWTEGKLSAVAWESVMEYVVFDDVADYTNAIEQSDGFAAFDDEDDYEE